MFSALLDAEREFGAATEIVEDIERAPLTYKRLILASLVLGDKLACLTTRHENAGVLLPNVNGLLATLFGLNAFGRTTALLNFTAGVKSLRSAVETAEIRTIVTSRRFIDTAKLGDVLAALGGASHIAPPRIVYLEDIRKSISSADKLKAAARYAARRLVAKWRTSGPDDPAVILFTSGTEGLPKGVVLSNANLIANALQIRKHAEQALFATDIVMNPLPMFHSFGLTAAALMPIFGGMRTVLYPSPLHYKQIPAMVRETQATVLFATDTFLQGYARAAEPGDLDTVRVAICGAERVKDTTRGLWAKRGTSLLEGYGATECAPVISCNLPDCDAPGTVGAILPGIEASLESVEGIAGGGKLLVRGPNVMLGYMRPERPGKIEPPPGGWHDTGDIVTIDAARMITIKGRAKRFAKIGGEMVSLAAVEMAVASIWPNANHVVVAVPDPRKGEQLVLVTEKPDAERGQLLAAIREQGISELWAPKSILRVPQIPLLGTGKIDYSATIELARAAQASP